jgi:ferredoxin
VAGRPTVAAMRLTIEADLCSGHGRCYTLEPALFDADDQGHGVVLFETISDGQIDAARRAAMNCPERAISISDD